VKKIREEKGYTQQQVAEFLGISVNYLRKIEGGKRNPSLKLAVRIAKLLDCTLNDLFF
jgi:putative transcriptional regulator